jgi:hypothetical protein
MDIMVCLYIVGLLLGLAGSVGLYVLVFSF